FTFPLQLRDSDLIHVTAFDAQPLAPAGLVRVHDVQVAVEALVNRRHRSVGSTGGKRERTGGRENQAGEEITGGWQLPSSGTASDHYTPIPVSYVITPVILAYSMSRTTLTLDERLHDYLLAHTMHETPAQVELRDETSHHRAAGMQISPEQGELMALLVKL